MINEEVEVAKGKQRQSIIKFTIVLLSTGILLLTVFWLLPILVSDTSKNDELVNESSSQSSAEIDLAVQVNQERSVSSQYSQEQALAAIQAFDQQLLLINPYQLLQDDERLMQAIDTAQAKVTGAFTAADYDTVMTVLQTISLDLEQAINAAEDAVVEHLHKASKLWDEKQLPQLQIQLQHLKLIQPSLPEALELRELLSAWPNVKTLIRAAKTAGLEGRYQQQLEALIKVSRLANDLPYLSAEIAGLKKQITEDNYRQAIASADVAKRVPDLIQMRKAINQARQISPQAVEVIRLTKELAELERKESYQRYLIQAELSLTKDQWLKAFEALSAAQQLYPQQESTSKKTRFVAAYLQLAKQSNQIVNQPSLLISSVKRKRATAMLSAMLVYRSLSPSMATLGDKLSKQLQRYSQKISLTVISDSKTYVEVRRIGKVGVVTEKTISLLPGNYVLEGKRSGYVTKTVKLVIKPEDIDKKVKVIADEQI